MRRNRFYQPRFATVVTHGATEEALIDVLNRILHLNLFPLTRAKKKNGSSIQVDGLTTYFNSNTKINTNDKIEKICSPYSKPRNKWKGHIYTIMDVKRVTREKRKIYLGYDNHKGTVPNLRSSFVKKHLITIYNNPDIEKTLIEGGLHDIHHNDKHYKHYVKVFSQQLLSKKTFPVQFLKFINRIKPYSNTNLELFLEDCWKHTKKF